MRCLSLKIKSVEMTFKRHQNNDHVLVLCFCMYIENISFHRLLSSDFSTSILCPFKECMIILIKKARI